MRKGHVVQVIGEVADYRGRRQLRVTSLRLLPAGSVDAAGLLPSGGDVAPDWEKLDPRPPGIAKPPLPPRLALFFHAEHFPPPYPPPPTTLPRPPPPSRRP